jgi:hypothetical protein
MFFALLAVMAAPAGWIPARWASNEAASLKLLEGTPVNCLVLERADWSAGFLKAAAERGIAALGVVRPGGGTAELAAQASAAGLSGILFEGDFEEAELAKLRAALADSKLASVALVPRTKLRFGGGDAVIGTYQGVWPGINTVEDGKTKAAPSGAPWIDTNTGFLRFLKASTEAVIWMGHRAPENQVISGARYVQAIADAEMLGAHWVVDLDAEFRKRLLAGEEKALADWKRMMAALAYFNERPEWRRLAPYGRLALVQDAESGGLFSGGVLDMISVKHTPVRAVPNPKLSDGEMRTAKMAVDVDPSLLTPEQKEVLRRFTRAGNTLLTAPPGWKMPRQRPDQITVDKDDVSKLDQIWKEVNSMTYRHNLGVRLFNVASTLTYLAGDAEGRRLVLHLVNYSDYDVEAVTAHFLGKYANVTLHAPGQAPRKLAPFEIEEGTGVEIDRFAAVATLVIE